MHYFWERRHPACITAGAVKAGEEIAKSAARIGLAAAAAAGHAPALVQFTVTGTGGPARLLTKMDSNSCECGRQTKLCSVASERINAG